MLSTLSTQKTLAKWLTKNKLTNSIHPCFYWLLSQTKAVAIVAICALVLHQNTMWPEDGAIGKKQNSRAHWLNILPRINETTAVKHPFLSPVSHESSVDLLALNNKEIKEIAAGWKVEKESKLTSQLKNSKVPLVKIPAKEMRLAENQFFKNQIDLLNQQTFAQLKLAAKSHENERLDFLKITEVALKTVASNPVANLGTTITYDQSDQIGFCFGRALLIHKLLLDAGIAQNQLAKIFVMGQLMYQKQHWNFHVAVMVRDSKHGFLVVDPLQGKPLPYVDWIAITSKYDIKGSYSRARFYVTNASKFLPSFENHSMTQLEEPLLKKYFDDLVMTMK